MTVQGHGWDDNVGYPAFRNLIINGGMSVAQRGTSTAGITGGGYYTADRYNTNPSGLGTWTQSIENDAPTGSGHRKSLKMLCTTADASPAASDLLWIQQIIEGYNVQHLKKGTASAKQATLSFWVKSNKTGTYIVNFLDSDNTRIVSGSYNIVSAGTWQQVVITFPADTTGVFDNDENGSCRIVWGLAAGTDYTSGTLNTTWAATVTANRLVGQTNLAAATSNYWQITGVQLEVGSVATPFEFEPFETTLRKCQRYYEKSYAYSTAPGTNQSSFPTIVVEVPFITSFGQADGWGGARTLFKVDKRASPTVAVYNESGTINTATQITGSTAVSLTNPLVYGNDKGFLVATGSLTAGVAVKMVYHYTANAEL
jgi:hypothetical protein